MLKDEVIRSEFNNYVEERRRFYKMRKRKLPVREAKIINADGNRLIRYEILNENEVRILSNESLDKDVSDYCSISKGNLLIGYFPCIFEYYYRIVK